MAELAALLNKVSNSFTMSDHVMLDAQLAKLGLVGAEFEVENNEGPETHHCPNGATALEAYPPSLSAS